MAAPDTGTEDPDAGDPSTDGAGPEHTGAGDTDAADKGAGDAGDEHAAADEAPATLPGVSDYLARACRDHQIVLVSDQRCVAQHLEALAAALPGLHGAGVTNLAWEFTNTRVQDRLDDLLASRTWNPRACADLFADLLGVGFGYREYADVLHAAWKLNANLGPDDTPLRVVALGVPTYVEDPDLLEGRSAGELDLRNWWLGGHYRDVSAFHMFNVLTTEVIRRGERALVYCDTAQTTTRLVEWIDGRPTTSLGNLLHRWMGEGVWRVLFHGAIGDGEAIERVEALVAAAPEETDRFGIDLDLSTLGNVGTPSVTGCIGGRDTTFRLGDIADGYLYVAARDDWRPAELLDDLIGPHNLTDVERRYRALDPREEPYTLDELEESRVEGRGAIAHAWPALPEPEPQPEPKRRFGRRKARA